MSPSLLLAAGGSSSDKFVDLDIHPWEWGALLIFITFLLVFDLLVVHRKPHEIHFKEAAIETRGLDLDRPRLHRRHLLDRLDLGHRPRHRCPRRRRRGQGGRRVHLGLPAREEPLDRQRVRVGGDLQLLRGAAEVPVPHPVLGHLRRAGAACDLHPRRLGPDRGASPSRCWSSALILLYTAQKIAFHDEHEIDPDNSIVLRAVRKVVPSTDKYDGQKLFTRIERRASPPRCSRC